MTEHDRPPAHSFSDRSVLALRITGDVDATTERDRSCIEALGQAGFPGTDNAREHEVRGGDEAACVEHPWVVDERPAGVQILTNEDSVGSEPAFSQEWVRTSKGCRCVLMPWQAKPPRRTQLRWSWFASCRNVYGCPTLSQLGGVLCAGRLMLSPQLLRL